MKTGKQYATFLVTKSRFYHTSIDTTFEKMQFKSIFIHHYPFIRPLIIFFIFMVMPIPSVQQCITCSFIAYTLCISIQGVILFVPLSNTSL